MNAILRTIALLSLAASVGWLCVIAGRDLDAVTAQTVSTLKGLDESRQRIERPTLQAMAGISSVTITAAQTIAKERNAFDSQQRYFDETRLRTNAILDEVKDGTIPALNGSLNHLDSAISDSGVLVRETRMEIETVGDSTGKDLDGIGSLTESLRVRVSDPAIGESLANVNAATGNLAATTADARKISDHYTQLILAPASKLKGAILFAASVAGRVLRIL